MSMIMVKPEYFDDFHCLGGDCRYTCCHGWGIVISKGEYSQIRAMHKSAELQKIVEAEIKRNKKETELEAYA